MHPRRHAVRVVMMMAVVKMRRHVTVRICAGVGGVKEGSVRFLGWEGSGFRIESHPLAYLCLLINAHSLVGYCGIKSHENYFRNFGRGDGGCVVRGIGADGSVVTVGRVGGDSADGVEQLGRIRDDRR